MKNNKKTKKEKNFDNSPAVSKSTAQRLPFYLRTLRTMIENNENRISSTILATKMNITPSQVRQDLASLGAFGLKGYGYDAQTLYTSILDIACVREEYSAVILGTQEMITMLTARPVFIKQGVALKNTFVTNKNSVLADFEDYCANSPVDIIVLATEDPYTKPAIEIIKKLNVKGVWNFSDVKLELDIPVKNIWIDDSLMTLCFDIGHRN